jgi:hypothetical protein
MEVCLKEEPAFEPVAGNHLASCWIYQKAVAKTAAEKQEARNG